VRDPSVKQALLVDPLWIDIETVRLWVSHCDAHHQGLCRGLPDWKRIESPSSLILIDVRQNCLVFVSEPTKYVALSYVWGRLTNTLETTIANVKALSQKGALSSSPWSQRLPGTIQDAIRLTSLLEVQYLWVDRLCIVQDDPVNKAEQLKSMASIYANSYVTAIAADGGDAEYGLRGIGRGSRPRHYEQIIFDFSSGCRMVQAAQKWVSDTTWDRRGWTFQERALSRRCLYFLRGKVIWQCYGGAWEEDITAEPHGVSKAAPADNTEAPSSYLSDSVDLKPWPDLTLYFRLVYRYNRRMLSFQSDGLEAFTAVITAMSRSFVGGFHFGIPELFFDTGLLWDSRWPLRRRAPKSDKFFASGLPSWSWAGWEGNLDSYFMTTAHKATWDNWCSVSEIDITPIVLWFKLNKDTGQKQAISNSYYSFRDEVKTSSLSLPPGWSRHRPADLGELLDRDGPLNFNNAEPEYVYRHEAVNETFVYPLPIPDRPLEPNSVCWEPQLYFRTTKALLLFGDILELKESSLQPDYVSNKMVPENPMIYLTDHKGAWVGILRLNPCETGIPEKGQSCELIAISFATAHSHEGSFAKEDIQEWGKIVDIRNKSEYEFYNVLWIEWNKGVAYRKALGRVWKTAWEQQTLEEHDIKLG
jgi:hypothetical protein